MGAYLDRSSAALDALRTNLIVSCSAGVALLLSMGVLGLRFRHYLRGKQLEEQLALARSVQQDLLPSVDPMGQEMDFAAQCVPAWQVGGDFYDVFEAGPGTVAVVLGDVSGKGLPAALLMGLLHGAVRTSRWTDSAAEHEEASLQLNKLLYTRTSGERYASMFWGCYDSRTHVLRYVNAGHLPPLVVGRGRTGEFSVRRLEEGGPVLGLLPSVSFRHGEVVVSPGELLVLYSDGIEEAMDSGEQQFGEERLIAAIKSSWGKPASMIRDAILENVESFLNRYPAHDDQTLVVAWLRSGQGEPGEKAEAAEEVLVS